MSRTIDKPYSVLHLTEEYFGEMNTPSKRAAIYVRFSYEGMSEDSMTLESQEKECRRYCADTSRRYEVVEEHVYIEVKSSTTRTYKERPKMLELINAAKRHEFDVIIVTEFGRLARKQSEQGFLIQLFKEQGVEVLSCTENFDDTALGRFMHSATAFASELEVEKIIYRTSRGKVDRLRNGHLAGSGYPNYGYKFVDTCDETNGRYEINRDVFFEGLDNHDKPVQWSQYDIVLWIWDRAEFDGWSINKIANILTHLGVPTAKGKQVWNNNQVHTILTSKVYLGHKRHLTYTRDENHKLIRRPEEEQLEVADGVVPPIIVTPEGLPDYERYDRVQQKLATHRVEALRSNKNEVKLGLLRCGYVKCGICGYSMRAHYHRKVHGHDKAHIHNPEYYCRANNGGEGLVNHHCTTIVMHVLDKAAWEFALPHILNPDLVRARIDELRELVKPSSNRDVIEAQIADIDKRMRNLLKLAEVAESDETIADLRASLKNYERQKREATHLLNDEKAEEEINAQINAELDRFEYWAGKVQGFINDPDYPWTYEEQRECIRVLGIQATVWPQGYDWGQEEQKKRFKLEVIPPRLSSLVSLTSVPSSSAQPPLL